MSNPGVLKGRIYQVLFEHGPMTYAALLKYIPDAVIRKIQNCVINDRFANKTNGKKVFRVIGYEPTRGKGGSPQPIIALGNEPDVESPVISNAHRDANGRYYARKRIERDESLTEEEKAVEAAIVLRDQQQQDKQLARSALVFQSMFGGSLPAALETDTARTYRTSNKELNQYGKTESNLSTHLQTDRRERSDVASGHCG